MQQSHQQTKLINKQINNHSINSDNLKLLSDSSIDSTGKFILVSNSNVRSYKSWKTNQNQIHYHSIFSRSDLPYPSSCLDWTTAHRAFDLLVAGTPTGRAFLAALPHSHQSVQSKPEQLLSSYPIINFSTSSSTRSCSSIKFDPSGKFIAIALEKTRDYTLQIYHVDQLLNLSQLIPSSSNSNQINFNPPPPQNSRSTSTPLSSFINKKTHQLLLSPYQPSSPSHEYTPSQASIAHAISSEAVHALEFMLPTHGSSQPTLLAAGLKLMRLYDLRSAGLKSNHTELPSPSIDYLADVLNPVAQWPVRSISGIKADPFVLHRFATWGDDACVKIWDTRKTNECVLQFSDDDVNLISNRIKSGRSSRSENSNSIISLTWSKARKGVLATLSSNSSRIRVWDIVDGVPPVQNSRSWSDGSLLNPFGTRNSLTPASGSVNYSNPNVNFRKSTILPRGSSPSTSPREKVQIPNYTVFSTRLLKPFSRPTQSVVDVNIPLQGETTIPPPEPYHLDFLGVSRDGQLEFVAARPSGEASFGSMGQIVYSHGSRLRIQPTSVLPTQFPQSNPPATSSLPTSIHVSNMITPSGHSAKKLDFDHPQPLSSDVQTCSFQEVSELRLANQFGRHLVTLPHSTETPNIFADLNNFSAKPTHGVLTNDISIVMMNRALSGYGPQPIKNQQVTTESPGLCAFWEWITHSDKLSQQGTSSVNGYDFSFKGVLAIMKGFLPMSDEQGLSGSQQATALNHQSSQQQANYPTSELFTPQSTIKQKTNSHTTRSNSNSKELSHYLKALRTFNHSHEVENFTISSEFSDQRQTALFLCGPDYNSAKLEEIVIKHEELGMYGKACAVALFSGNTKRAITSLQRSDDLQLRTLAPTLATHLNTQRLNQARDPVFDQVCRQLSDERTSEPYLRAIFAYCSTGDWHEVIDETGLPLKDRLAVGLRFLSDEEIFNWLESTAKDLIQSGDLEGILLTGLNLLATLSTKKTEFGLNGNVSTSHNIITRSGLKNDELGTGFELIQTYLNRSGDLQTAALASHLIVPARIRLASAERWIESYRKLLDRWMLFKIRIEFDLSRGQKSRQRTGIENESSNHIMKTKIPHQVNHSSNNFPGNLLAPPQFLIRCQHCQEVVSDGANVNMQLNVISGLHSQNFNSTTGSFFPSSSSGGLASLGLSSSTSKKSGPGPIGFSLHSRQSNRCRVCGKSLPKCSICLIPLTISDLHSSSIWAWCHRCRHVGHAHHLREWQDRGNIICPVSGCDCNCWDSVN